MKSNITYLYFVYGIWILYVYGLLLSGLPCVCSPDVKRTSSERETAEHVEARGGNRVGNPQSRRRLPRNDRNADQGRSDRIGGHPELHPAAPGGEEGPHDGPDVHPAGEDPPGDSVIKLFTPVS